MKHIFYSIITISFLALGSFSATGQCFDDGHSPFQDQGWLSCNTSVGPIPERGDAHWIMYDFGHVYSVDSIYFWNHNVWGETGMGVKNILIDYSTDKQNWTTVGPITVEKAPGSWKYTGTQGPSLGSVNARYVLVTVISTWRESSSCAGLGEIKFSVDNVVDVVDVDPVLEWAISPNPASEQITINLPSDGAINKLSIFNSIGQTVHQVTSMNGQQLTIPLEGMQEGVYYVSLETDKQIHTKTFVKIN